MRGGGSKTELKLDDATKMVGCYKALAKIGFKDNEDEEASIQHMRRALAFCRSIKLSETFTEQFMNVVDDYRNSDEIEDEFKTDLTVELEHVDGTFNADQRNKCLNWLKEETDGDVCRVLSNARCLAEGVDVPALDAVLFLHPRKSQIEVVQSVGRVMRKADGKELGYVILPVTVAPGVNPDQTLNENKKFSVIWQVLNALRAHDERLDSTINKIGLGEDVSKKIEIVGLEQKSKLDPTKAEIDDIRRKSKGQQSKIGEEIDGKLDEDMQLSFTLTEISKAIRAKIVDKCGTRDYWENWAHDIADIAKQHIKRIEGLIANKNSAVWDAFSKFYEEIKDDLNPEIKEEDAVKMLAQHMVTKPVFDTLFQGNQFTEENAISKAMEITLERLYQNNVDSEAETLTLNKFYKSVELRAEGIETAKGRQKLILDLYDRFFKKAFKSDTEKLGIVYTPTEVVDFIIRSVEDVLNDEFCTSLNNEGVHVLDPFAGTGTFITRLLQSEIITKQNLQYKYKNEIHANEIVLLANYIAGINIESTYHDIIDDDEYHPFNGIVLTDTFQLYEQENDMVADLLPDNSLRRTSQKKQKITVIMGNPPYSAGQKDAGDNAKNVFYPNLSRRIVKTYGIHSSSTLQRFLHDSYIRAIRWSTDRIGNDGIVAFVIGAGWIDRKFADGMRKCLAEEYSSIYILHLRGDVRKNIQSDTSDEGENIFGNSSMTGISIVILVKNSKRNSKCKISYADIGKNLTRKEKLSKISHMRSILAIGSGINWQKIVPNKDHEWINQGDTAFAKFKTVFCKREPSETGIFNNYSLGVSTNRDSWVINFSPSKAAQNTMQLINFYNNNLQNDTPIEQILAEHRKIKWSNGLISSYRKGNILNKKQSLLTRTLYRPFTHTILVNNRELIERYSRNSTIFPNSLEENLAIAITGPGSLSGFSVIMTDRLLNLDAVEKVQCFPLNLYQGDSSSNKKFFSLNLEKDQKKLDGISNKALQYFQETYNNKSITKQDIFYYIYGVLHSQEYRDRFSNNLRKELPRIPTVRKFDDFLEFSRVGKLLGELHVNFEDVEAYPVVIKEGGLRFLSPDVDRSSHFRVEKMKFGSRLGVKDKTTVMYNKNITMENIPLQAYDYVISGKPALKWVMDQQCVKTDKKSGITNDANDYANEVMKDPAYPLKLFQRVITVSLETMTIVRGLPKLDID